mgnify:CR=1 FL=1|tara:strand:- start:158 stop:385 length:228 start_codon:yes stop_codon:yes gene_type:complete
MEAGIISSTAEQTCFRKAVAHLAQLGYTCNISPPVIINPAGSRFTTVVPQILVKFTSSVGGLAVRIGLTENSRPD